MEHIRKRKDFLAAARASSLARASLVLQVRNRGDEAPARLGFTTTKKLGLPFDATASAAACAPPPGRCWLSAPCPVTTMY